ncbi:6-phosphogluconolactonase [Pseudomonas psychrotolerans L19]|uniref:6-phosphogluconolactonase n=1 Tax=Pseudomonas TaxID=286 RepID=UPI00023A38B2|nr:MULTISPECIES: 6-phosphogluconolactonase [Pseudomonas]EHK72653.1 6-phosphogluconolactonase [Pseudomonas psychrotolerans L19]MBA1179156.1 6-phosphogluconolactonase [Pseudomonas psychrotolerans]MBA1211856.1 6-phosphogluconolactonase [Pseudomonas psychrotolerans]TCQ92299.1 6-phosphogluconolactonase [Pseudomonas sp. JUb52]
MATSDLGQGVTLRELPDRDAHAAALAETVTTALREALAARGEALLIVSGGRSPVPFLERLARAELDWSRVLVTLADERWVPADHPDSNAGLLRKHLFQGPAAAAGFVDLYSPASSTEEGMALTEARLRDALATPDVLVLGMGDDAHTASLFPGSPGLEEALDPASERLSFPGVAPSAPQTRITLSRAYLSRARQQILAIQGAGKRQVLETALAEGDELATPIKAFLREPLVVFWCP